MKKYYTPEKMNKVYKEYCLYRQQAAKEGLLSILYLNLTDKIEKIIHPVLVIVGQKDCFAKPMATKKIFSSFANAEMKIIPNADHGCVGEHPEEMAKDIRKFLRKN